MECEISVINENICHNIVQCNDDSTNIVASNNNIIIQKYIKKYFKMNDGFYNLNKLMINSGKSKLIVICKAKSVMMSMISNYWLTNI